MTALGIVFATILGTFLGVARLSPNWLLSRLALVYVELVRNIPLLLQLLLIYSVLNVAAPPPRGAGICCPACSCPIVGWSCRCPRRIPPIAGSGSPFSSASWRRSASGCGRRRRQAATGRRFPVAPASAGLILGLPTLAWLTAGAPFALSVPALQGFNFAGGASLSPELTALLGGLVIYTASYIAEIVRGGIVAVSHGQTEAAAALGLRRGLILPPHRAAAGAAHHHPAASPASISISPRTRRWRWRSGFRDLVFVANTQINQTGQAIEGMAIVMATYLTLSVGISIVMNIYNARLALKER